MSQSNQQNESQLARNLPGIVGSFIQGIGTSVEVFLRRGFGERYLGTQAATVLLSISIYITFWRSEDVDVRPLLWFLAAYVFALFCARLEIVGRRLRGEHCHSYYNGTPYLQRFFPNMDERKIKHYVEPAVVLAIAYLIGNHCPPLALYLCFAAGVVFVSSEDIAQQERRKAQDMYDAVVDQECVGERFRDMRGDDY